MMKLTNTSKAPKAVLMTSGQYAMLHGLESKEFDRDKVAKIPPEVVEGEPEQDPGEGEGEGDQDSQQQGDGAGDQQQSHPLDRDRNGEKGGSLPDDPPALSGMTRAELEKELEACRIDIATITGTGKDGAVVMADIRDAIEAHRAKGA